MNESYERLTEEVDRDYRIEKAVEKLEKLKSNSITQRQFDLKDRLYQDRERRFSVSSDTDPRTAEIALFRSTYRDQQNQIKALEAELESLGYTPEPRHPGPTGEKTRECYLREAQIKRGIIK